MDTNSTSSEIVLNVENLSVYYGDFLAVKDVTMSIPRNKVTAFIGPSGCGKSTFIRCLNRMNDLIPTAKVEGKVIFENEDIYDDVVDATEIRSRIGMVFQKPNPLPISVYENIVFGLRIHNEYNSLFRTEIDNLVELSLKEVFLWDSLKDKLKAKATNLQLEQQQKLCIARLLPLKPQIILMDEPCSALDAGATRAVEELMKELAGRYTILIVTHNMAQARRISEECFFMLLGKIVESGQTEQMFVSPKDPRTDAYIAGRYA